MHLWSSLLENPRDWGAWWAAVYGVAQSRTRLKWLSSSSSSSGLNCDYPLNFFPAYCIYLHIPLLIEQTFLTASYIPGTVRGESQCFFLSEKMENHLCFIDHKANPACDQIPSFFLALPDQHMLLEQLHKAEHWCVLHDNVPWKIKNWRKQFFDPGIECHIFWIPSVSSTRYEHDMPGFVIQRCLTCLLILLFIHKTNNNRTLPCGQPCSAVNAPWPIWKNESSQAGV